MRLALILSLVASASFGQGRFDRFNSRTDQGRSHRGFPQSSGAFFEFAPASGAGMGTACACAAITGAKGETMTFTRTGDATCSKQGLATTGIANGDLVTCTANLPRVESSGGVLGLRVEGARTNETLRSQAIDNVAWATTVSGVAAPTITADFAVAPDGTTTADRMQIPACPTVGNASGINQTSGTIASPSSSSVYLKANSGTPSVSVCMFGLASGTRACTQFALNTSTWTRAAVPNVTNTGGMNLEIACENRTASYTGATDTGAADILVWGAQSEAGAYATSYIPTVAAAVTRNADAPPWFSVVPSSVASGSMSARVVLFATAANGLLSAEATTAFQQSIITFGGERAYVGGVSLVGPLAALAAGQHDVAMWWTNSSTNLILNGSQTSGAAGSPVATDRLLVGGYGGGNLEPGLYSRVCYDSSPSRCR